MSDNQVPIGDILVHRGEPQAGNPYRGSSICGRERSKALGRFLRLGEISPYSFWHAPACGGAKRLETPPNVQREVLDYYWTTDGGTRR